MELSIYAIGRLKGAEQELCDRYLERINQIGRGLGVTRAVVLDFAEARDATAVLRKEREAALLCGRLPAGAHLQALDERGRQLTSEQFAKFILSVRDSGAGQLVFALGGADGHGEALLARAAGRLSLSAATLPHGLARVVLAEQLYRALTIIAGHPYHRV
jgi:23S rRNA (pseudouridine1915-N3)-methyltransferase